MDIENIFDTPDTTEQYDINDIETFNVSDENKMILTGFIGFLDPPKESAKEADANEQRYKDELPDLETIDYYERLKRERQKVNSVLDEEEDFDFEELDSERVMKL